MLEVPSDSVAAKAHREKIREIFVESRAMVTGALSKTIILSIAALAVVWLSGLEPTRRLLNERSHEFAENNRLAQIESRKIIRRGEIAVASAYRAVAEVKWLFEEDGIERRRAELDDDLKEAEDEKSEKEIKRAKQRIANFKAELQILHLDNLKNESEDQKRSLLEKARKPKLENLQIIRTKAADDISNREKDFEKKRSEQRERRNSQERNVTFELAGFKFNAPPLPAPLLWSASFLGLLAYISRNRLISTQRAIQGFQMLANLPDRDSETIVVLAGKQSPWVMRPCLTAFVRSSKGVVASNTMDGPWLNWVFGTRQIRDWTMAASVFLAWIALLFQLRVCWLALDFSRYIGSNNARVTVACLVLILVTSTMALITWWLQADEFFKKHRIESTRVLLLLLAAAFLLAATTAWVSPTLWIKFGITLQQYLWLLALYPLPIVLLTLLRGAANPAVGKTTKLCHQLTRRKFLGFGIIALAMGITAYWSRTSQNLPLPRRPRYKPRKSDRKKPGLQPGLHRGTPSDHRGEVVVFHFVDSSRRMWRGGRLPLQLEYESRLGSALKTIQNSFAKYEIQLRDSRADLNESGIMSPTLISRIQKPTWRVHLASASWAFEQMALDAIDYASGSVQSDKACRLLLLAIRHDVLYKQSHGRPSFRLYDLLAGLSVRYRHPKYLEELRGVVAQSGHLLSFQTRLERWDNPQSVWYKKWRTRPERCKWSTDSRAVVF
jgi:hypothetical protein